MKSVLYMETQRITISVPNHIYVKLKERVSAREVSKFVANVLAKELDKVEEIGDPVEEFLALRKDAPKVSREDILAGIQYGRL